MLLHLDFETYSALNLKQVGAYRYAEDPSTEILVCCYAFDDGLVKTWLPWKNKECPEDLARAVARGVEFCAHNAQFERAIWQAIVVKRHKGPPTRPQQFLCTMALAAQAALPRSLEGVGNAIGAEQKKDTVRAKMLKLFSQPHKPTKKDPRPRIKPTDEPVKFRELVKYCQQDVRSEREVHAVLPPMPPEERSLWALDMIVNERGMPFDLAMVRKVLPIIESLGGAAAARVRKITGVNPTQVAKLRAWVLTHKLPLPVPNMRKETLEKVIIHPKLHPKVKEVLELRLEAGIVSTKKLYAMLRVCGKGGRARGTIMWYGAHTGRWSGKLIQPHNFKRGGLTPRQQLAVFDALDCMDADLFLRVFDEPLTTISQCMRGFIMAPDGKRLLVVDYTAIEARVLAWLAGEVKMLRAFREGLDVYKVMAAKLFGVRYEDVTKEQRRIAKNLVLGCGYQLGGKKFVDYCARAGVYITEDFGIDAVAFYRDENEETVKLWGKVERAAIAAVQRGGAGLVLKNVLGVELKFRVEDQWLTIELPSGRKLYYFRPKVQVVIAYGKPKNQLTFLEEFRGRLVRAHTYGGRLVENIVQAIARDFMAHGMQQCEAHGYDLIGTVHDELVTEVPLGSRHNVQELERIVCEPPKWGKMCPVNAEGFECKRYRKG